MKCGKVTPACPALEEETPGGDFIAIGKKLDPTEVGGRSVAEDEVASRIPRDVVLKAFHELALTLKP